MSLLDIYGEKYGDEQEKLAKENFNIAEEEAAGKFLARGFHDELNKISGDTKEEIKTEE